jgi:hypothetical protein
MEFKGFIGYAVRGRAWQSTGPAGLRPTVPADGKTLLQAGCCYATHSLKPIIPPLLGPRGVPASAGTGGGNVGG